MTERARASSIGTYDIPGYPRAVAERLGEQLSEHDTDILDAVMRVDVKIALHAKGDEEPAVHGEGVQHMVEKSDAGAAGKPAAAASVELEGHLYLGFERPPVESRRPDGVFIFVSVCHVIYLRSAKISVTSRMKAAFSSGSPAVILSAD